MAETTTTNAACKLEARDIHKRYGDNEVLKGVSLSAKAGDVISIIGASGSGKSTFLRCINFLERPNAGQIVVDGETVRTKADRAGNLEVADHKQLQRIRTKLAMVFQHFNLWAHMNVLENVMEAPVHVLGSRSARRRSARANIWRRWGSRRGWRRSIRRTCRAASSSGSRSRARSRCTRT
ncbi:hypothetical protein BpKM391_24420 [Burkholderia pseudomallei]|nr:ATP-binding cassette domain-containing protein [Burkholderia pseudomallei]BEH67367.1 hypothetical protein BpKM391_24420 [Burkholderia pseudomallei]